MKFPLRLCFIICFVPLVLIAVGWHVVSQAYKQDIAKMATNIADFSEQDLAYSSKIFDTTNALISHLGYKYRFKVKLSELSNQTIHMFLAAEDKHFYSHIGISPKAIFRALIRNIQHGRFVEGGSTITQQVARHFFLHHKKLLSRKAKELVISLGLERNLTKSHILSIYLNEMYFGKGAYGIEAAAHSYFQTSAKNLSINQAAYLAGLLKAPSRLSSNHRQAHLRQLYILKRAFDEGWISQKAYNKAIATTTKHTKISNKHHPSKQRSYYLDALQKELHYFLPTQSIHQGLHIYSTFSPKWQSILDSRLHKRYALLKQLSQHHPQVFHRETELAGVVYDSSNAEILALRGGKDYSRSVFNRAIYTQRPMQLTVIPFLTLVLLMRGELVHKQANSLQNQDHHFYTLAYAVRQYGYGSLKNLFAHLGHSTQRQDMGLLLGEERISPLKLAELYGALLLGRKPHLRPTFFRKVIQVHPQTKTLLRIPNQYDSSTEAHHSTPSHLLKHPSLPTDCSTAVFSFSKDRMNYWMVEIQNHIIMVGWIGSERGNIALPKLSNQEQQHFKMVAQQNHCSKTTPAFSYLLAHKLMQKNEYSP